MCIVNLSTLDRVVVKRKIVKWRKALVNCSDSFIKVRYFLFSFDCMHQSSKMRTVPKIVIFVLFGHRKSKLILK